MSEKHETVGAAMYQALPRLAEDIASRRAEDSTFIHKNLYSVQIFVNKIDHVPRCRRRIGPFIQANA